MNQNKADKVQKELNSCRTQLARAQAMGIEAGSQLQSSVLLNNQMTSLHGIEYATFTMPSKFVDGDFLDIIQLTPDSMDVILGDVMGKGMEAAILGTIIKVGFLRCLATNLFGKLELPSIEKICTAAESIVVPQLQNKKSIATLSYLRVNQKEQIIEFVDCGHTSIIHYSHLQKTCRAIKGSDMPMGFVDVQDMHSYLVPFREGDIFLLYSDGLSECQNIEEEAFGEERIMYVTQTYADLSPKELTNTLARLVFDFSASGFVDDVTLFYMKVGDLTSTTLERQMILELMDDTNDATEKLNNSLHDSLVTCGFDDEAELGTILLACHEALLNIQTHGLPNKQGQCSALWRIHADIFTLELSYVGRDYSWWIKPKLNIEDYKNRGYGIAIIHEYMDSVVLASGFQDQKTLILVRRLKCPIPFQ